MRTTRGRLRCHQAATFACGATKTSQQTHSACCLLTSASPISRLPTQQVGFPDLAKAKGALGNVFKVVDRSSPIDSSSPEGLQPDSRTVRGELELQNVVS